MRSELWDSLARIGVPVVDEANAADVLTGGAIKDVLVFFPGNPAERPEAADVAVIFPQLLAAFDGRLRGAVAASGAELSLGKAFRVDVLPSLALVRDGVTIGVIPRVRDWAEYLEKIAAFLDCGAPVAPPGPWVAITSAYKGAKA